MANFLCSLWMTKPFPVFIWLKSNWPPCFYLIYIFSNFQYFWTKTFGDSYTSIRQIFSTWQWLPSIWCDYIWICKNVQYLNEKPVKVVERSKFTIVNMFSMHINNFFFYFIYFSYSLRTVYFLDCLYLGLLGVGTSLFPPAWSRFRDTLVVNRKYINVVLLVFIFTTSLSVSVMSPFEMMN